MLPMQLDPIFMQEFRSWFNADVVNLDNPDEVRDAAENCALYLDRKVKDKELLLSQLHILLHQWTPHSAIPFIAATDADWSGDDDSDQVLKDTLAYIIEYLESVNL